MRIPLSEHADLRGDLPCGSFGFWQRSHPMEKRSSRPIGGKLGAGNPQHCERDPRNMSRLEYQTLFRRQCPEALRRHRLKDSDITLRIEMYKRRKLLPIFAMEELPS